MGPPHAPACVEAPQAAKPNGAPTPNERADTWGKCRHAVACAIDSVPTNARGGHWWDTLSMALGELAEQGANRVRERSVVAIGFVGDLRLRVVLKAENRADVVGRRAQEQPDAPTL